MFAYFTNEKWIVNDEEQKANDEMKTILAVAQLKRQNLAENMLTSFACREPSTD